MDLRDELKSLLADWKPGRVMKTAYDTAWVARLGEVDPGLSNAALRWITENQLPDGSWGAAAPLYYHDRVISTLGAMIALTRQGRRSYDRKQIELGQLALERIAGGATLGLSSDPNGATVGFEVVVPTLIAEAETLGILKLQGERILGRLKRLREAKMERLNGLKISRNLPIAYSAEMAGVDCLHLFDLENLQEFNGSVAHCPSATAYFARYVRPGDPAAMHYLRSVVGEDGGTPMAAPLDITERSWVLWNLALTGELDGELRDLCLPHLSALKAAWSDKNGIGFGTDYSVPDGDDTGLVYAVLTRFGYTVDINAVYHYEEPDCFRCNVLETSSSISANLHILEAFRQAGLERNHPAVQKIVRFLRKNRQKEGYWLDKWHTSPYYATTHAVISLMDYDRQLAEDALRWILKTRDPRGSWGFFMPTAEETAYALQALCTWAMNGGAVSRSLIKQSAAWLENHMEQPWPPLWIAKTLYYSEWIVRSEIISALVLAAKI
jgi:halimadienyl-diphosphate synthase